jgi:hypothetical protein
MPDESKRWSEQGMEAMLNHLLQTPADYVAPPEWAYPTRDEDLLQRIRNPATTPEDKSSTSTRSEHPEIGAHVGPNQLVDATHGSFSRPFARENDSLLARALRYQRG